MVIDYILDRKDGYGYDVKEFYDACMAYEEFDIARALDSGTEKDVKKALCNYVIDNDYPKSICKYINSENWLGEFEESKKSARKSLKESKIKAITDYQEIKVFLDGHTKPSEKYQTYSFSLYSKKYEINGVTDDKDDVTLTFEEGRLKSFTYLGDTENFDKKNHATHFSNSMDKGWICEFNNDGLFYGEHVITFRLQLFKFM